MRRASASLAQLSSHLLNHTHSDNVHTSQMNQPRADGVAKIRYMSVEAGNGKSQSLGKCKSPLPAELSDLSKVRQLVIAASDGVTITQELATANLEISEHLTYLVKRDISMNDVPASLRIQANDQRGQFRLTADNLAPETEYWLVLNGPVAVDGGTEQVFTTDAKGKLAIGFTIENPLDALALRKIQVRDLSEEGLSESDLNASLVLEVSLP